MKTNLFWLIQGQTHFSTSWHAKTSLILIGLILNLLCSNLHTASKHELKTYQKWEFLYAKTTNFQPEVMLTLEDNSVGLYLYFQFVKNHVLLTINYEGNVWMVWSQKHVY
jgi:hypothetical protein